MTFLSSKAFWCIGFCCAFTGYAQQKPGRITPDTLALKQVIVTATILKAPLLETPLAVSVIQANALQAGTPQISLKEYLGQVPGLFAQNQYNYNQDLRIAIRGFGARAAFGIRGVKIVVDGIPETTPDGQGQLDNMPLGILNTIEILRGPSSALYGNAAGGVLMANTIDHLNGQKVALRAMGGAFGLVSRQATLALGTNTTANLKKRSVTALIHYHHTASEGYRANSRFKQDLFNAKLFYTPIKDHAFIAQFNYTNSPYAKDPGGIHLTQAQEMPRSARAANLKYVSSERIDHSKFGLSHQFSFPKTTLTRWTIKSFAFMAQRNFEGFLPFEQGGVSAFKRNYAGLGSHISRIGTSQTVLGWGYSKQKDLRSRYNNLEGILGALTARQNEKYENFHSFLTHKKPIGLFNLSGAIRYDKVLIQVIEKQKKQRLTAWSPNIAIGYAPKKNQYLSLLYAQSFETPTLSELTNAPDGSLGFNSNLKPITAQSFEGVYRGNTQFKNSFLNWEIAAFITQTNNEILPFELAQFPQRQFYKNLGATQRKGVEVQFNYKGRSLEFHTAYTYAQYTFKSIALPADEITGQVSELFGKKLPGIPNHHLNSTLKYTFAKQLVVTLAFSHIGALMANNENTVKVAPYHLINLSAHKTFKGGWGAFKLFGGLNNVGNTTYFDNIRINAFGGRYYEPAPLRNGYLGLEWRR